MSRAGRVKVASTAWCTCRAGPVRLSARRPSGCWPVGEITAQDREAAKHPAMMTPAGGRQLIVARFAPPGQQVHSGLERETSGQGRVDRG
jgi:hypothetical protein